MTAHIAKKVHELRVSRRWTQRELATKLGTSQSRLSELEAGAGSFSAEQFLTILTLFNVTTDHFATTREDPADQVHHALARLGATNLLATAQTLPSERIAEVAEAIREALAIAEPRLLTALAPVLVVNSDRINFGQLDRSLRTVGLANRFAWIADNVQTSLVQHAPNFFKTVSRSRRAYLLLSEFVKAVPTPPPDEPWDILEHPVRTKKTLAAMEPRLSPQCQTWRVVSSLVPADFGAAIEASDVGR